MASRRSSVRARLAPLSVVRNRARLTISHLDAFTRPEWPRPRVERDRVRSALMHTGYRDVLSIRRYRWLWLGETASSLGDSVSFVALVWLVYETSGSSSTVG